MAAFTTAMADGSYLIVAAGTPTGSSPVLIERARSAYTGTSFITSPTQQEIATWYTGLHLVPPAWWEMQAWRPARRGTG